MTEQDHEVPVDPVDVTSSPIMVVTQTFSARPSAWPDARDFLLDALREVDPRQATAPEIQAAIEDALLGSANGGSGAFQVSVRIMPESVEVEVLRDAPAEPTPRPTVADLPDSFATWLADLLARDGLSHEQAARQFGVSVRTIGRWVRGETEPRMREMRRVNRAAAR